MGDRNKYFSLMTLAKLMAIAVELFLPTRLKISGAIAALVLLAVPHSRPALASQPIEAGTMILRPSVQAGASVSSLNNFNYGMGADFDPETRGDKRLRWTEGYFMPMFEADLPLSEGRISFDLALLGAATGGDGEADRGGEAAVSVETAQFSYGLKTEGGGLTELRAGKGRYSIGEGFLLGDGSRDGGGKAAQTLNPRKSFGKLASLSCSGGSGSIAIFALEGDDENGKTSLFGGNAELALGRFGSAGASVFRILNADLPSREGMNVLEARYDGSPLVFWTERLKVRSELAFERRAADEEAARVKAGAAFLEAAVLLPFWDGKFSMSYGLYSGDKEATSTNEEFDTLFQSPLGRGDVGWRPGEIVGYHFQGNSNLVNITTALSLRPVEAINMTAAFYHLDVDHKYLFGEKLLNIHFGDELDLYVEAQTAPQMAVRAIYGHAWTGDGPRRLGFNRQQDLVRASLEFSY